MTIKDWIDVCHGLAREKGWWTPYLARENAIRELSADQVLSKLMLVVTELAEAAEEVRLPNHDPRLVYFESNGGPAEGVLGTKVPYERWQAARGSEAMPKPEGFGVEVADAVIRIFDLCGAMGVDLEAAVKLKHEYNARRSQRHGNKRA